MAGDVTVRLACGCRLVISGGTEAPHCATHDEYRVQSVTAPPPRFTACGIDVQRNLGPLVTHALTGHSTPKD